MKEIAIKWLKTTIKVIWLIIVALFEKIYEQLVTPFVVVITIILVILIALPLAGYENLVEKYNRTKK